MMKHAPAKLAVFLVFSAAIAGYMAIVLSESYTGETVDYQAEFADVSQLAKGQQVRVAGVTIGKVTDVEVARNNRIRVSFTADRSRPLTTSTRAVVRFKDLIGNRYLELQEGSGGTSVLPPGGLIPIERTAAALDLDTLFNGFKPLFQGLSPAQINAVSTELVRVLQGQSGSIYSLLTTISSLTNTLADRNDLVGKVIGNLNVVLGTVADHGTDVKDLISQLQSLVSGLNKDAPQLLDSVVTINSFTASATQLLDQVDAPLGVDLAALEQVAATMNRNSATVQFALDRLGPAYQRMMRVGSYGNFFNIYVCGIRLKMSNGNEDVTNTPYLAKSDVERCK